MVLLLNWMSVLWKESGIKTTVSPIQIQFHNLLQVNTNFGFDGSILIESRVYYIEKSSYFFKALHWPTITIQRMKNIEFNSKINIIPKILRGSLIWIFIDYCTVHVLNMPNVNNLKFFYLQKITWFIFYYLVYWKLLYIFFQ